MGGSKPKQFTRPPPKKKAKTSPVTADDFQEAADFEEAAGGKHRVGDPVKSGRAFLRALEFYDNGLKKYPSNLDLSYNKARLQLEISQQPALVEHIGVSLVDWLQITLESHRHALKLSQENPDAMFNTAQVLISLAEELSEDDRAEEAAKPLQEALELLSACLSRQEMMFEQHRLDFPDTEEGGVAVSSNDQPATTAAAAPSADTDMDEQSATVETPVSANDLLDTVHASLSALTTLIPLVDESALQNLGDMSHALTEDKAPRYLALLPSEEQDSARLSVALDRAVFIAAYANAQFEAQVIELTTYIERLNSFDVPGKDNDASMLCADADARIELVLSALDRFGEQSSNLPATTCWKQLSLSQDLYSQASKLTTEDALDRKAEVYKSKGDLELLRHRIATLRNNADLSDVVKKSAKTLIANAQTFYKGAVQLAKQSDDEDVEEAAEQRGLIAREIAAVLYGGPSAQGGRDEDDLMEILEGCVDEGLVSQSLAGAIMQDDGASGS